jgi:hypothetical protein
LGFECMTVNVTQKWNYLVPSKIFHLVPVLPGLFFLATQ